MYRSRAGENGAQFGARQDGYDGQSGREAAHPGELGRCAIDSSQNQPRLTVSEP